MKKHFSLPKLLLLGLTAAFALSAVSCKDDDKKKTPSGGDDITDTDVPTPTRTVVFENEVPTMAYYSSILTDSQGRVRTLFSVNGEVYENANIYYLDDNTVSVNIEGISLECTVNSAGLIDNFNFHRVVLNNDLDIPSVKSLADIAALKAVDESTADEDAEYYGYEITGYAHYDNDNHLVEFQFAYTEGEYDLENNFFRNENFENDVTTVSYTWADGNLQSLTAVSYYYDPDKDDYVYTPEETVTYTYGTTPNKGNVMLANENIAFDEEDVELYFTFYYAGLLGKSSAFLPTSYTYASNFDDGTTFTRDYPLTWGLDDQGFPYACSGGMPTEGIPSPVWTFSSTPDDWESLIPDAPLAAPRR